MDDAESAAPAAIELGGIEKSFKSRHGIFHAVRGLDLAIINAVGTAMVVVSTTLGLTAIALLGFRARRTTP